MAIRLTESRLRQIIREEVASLNEGANTNYEAQALFKIFDTRYESPGSENSKLNQAIDKAWWTVCKNAGLPMDALRNLWKRTMNGVWGTYAPGADFPQGRQSDDVIIAAIKDFIEQADSMLGGSLIELTTAALSPTRANQLSMRMRQNRPKTEDEQAAEKARRSAAALRGHGARGSIDYSRYGG